jgi:hypothetical protein
MKDNIAPAKAVVNVTVTEEHELFLDDKQIIDLLRLAGYTIPLNMKVSVTVAHDEENEIDSENNIIVRWQSVIRRIK